MNCNFGDTATILKAILIVVVFAGRTKFSHESRIRLGTTTAARAPASFADTQFPKLVAAAALFHPPDISIVAVAGSRQEQARVLDQLDAVQHLVTVHSQQIDQGVVVVGGIRSSTAHNGQVAVCFCRHIAAIAVDVEAIVFIQQRTDAAALDIFIVIRCHQPELMIRVVGSSSGVLVDADVLKDSGKVRLKDFCNVRYDGTTAYDGDDVTVLKHGVKAVQWVGPDGIKAELLMPDGTVRYGLIEPSVVAEESATVQLERIGFAKIEEKGPVSVKMVYSHR